MMESFMIFLLQALTVISYILALLSPFIFLAWLFTDWRNHKRREKRWNETMRNRYNGMQKRR